MEVPELPEPRPPLQMAPPEDREEPLERGEGGVMLGRAGKLPREVAGTFGARTDPAAGGVFVDSLVAVDVPAFALAGSGVIFVGSLLFTKRCWPGS